MESWSRSEVIGVVAVVIAVIAAIANVVVIHELRAKRTLLFAVAFFSLASIALLYKVETMHAAEARRQAEARAREAQDAIKREAAIREEAIQEARERIRREDAEQEAIRLIARDKAVEEAKERILQALEPPELRAAKKAIVGKWDGGFFHVDFIFTSDGRFQVSQALARSGGHYRFIDSTHIEVTTHPWEDPSKESAPYGAEVHISNDTLHLKSEWSWLNGKFPRDKNYREY